MSIQAKCGCERDAQLGDIFPQSPERQIAVQEDANFGALLRWRLEVGRVCCGGSEKT